MHNLRIIKAMCGYESYANLAIATTMWPEDPTSEEIITLSDREAELFADDKFFGALVDQGATLFRHDQGASSAKRIISHLKGQLGIQAPEPLQLQRELIDQQKTLGETTAGIAVHVDLYKVRQAHALELHNLKLGMSNQLTAKDAAHAADLRELKEDILENLKKDEDDANKLKKTMEEMQEQGERSLQNKIKALNEQFRDLLKDREQTLSDMQESLREISNNVARRSQQPVKAQQVQKHQEAVANAQEEVDQAYLAFQRFQERTNQAINGSVNGVAAGITTAVATTGEIDS
jgi:chromosome segregation ATPase